MKLSDMQNKLLLQATKMIRDFEFRNLLLDCIVQHAETNDWFREALFIALKHGVVVDVVCSMEKFLGQYGINQYKIILNGLFFKESIPQHILRSFLTMIFRHELTHAIDFIKMKTTYPS